MRCFLIFFFLAIGFSKGFCDPPRSSIKSNYATHQIIFYGEFLGCHKLNNAYDTYGYNIVIQNYKILKKVKGFEKIFEDSIASDIISIRHAEYELNSNYCGSFTGKKFIIYALKTIYSRSSFPTFNNEFPSREINDNNFMVEESVIKEEIGKNELELLIQYRSKDTIDYWALKRKAYDESEYYQGIIADQKRLIDKQKVIISQKGSSSTIIAYILGVALLLIVVLSLRKGF